MKKVISASRRTDLIAFFPEWLSRVLAQEKALVYGPSRKTFEVDLRPECVHTIVLWSKNFANLLENRHCLRDILQKFDQVYFHFTITGLGGSVIESGVPPPSEAFSQLEKLVELSGNPERVSVRFDPLVYWKEQSKLKTNLTFLEKLAPRAAALGVRDVRFSFAQWYEKARRRAGKYGFAYVDPPREEKLQAARLLVRVAESYGLSLWSCSQDFLTEVAGVRASACIDGQRLQNLHPQREPVSFAKDNSQRRECRCTESIDIGSYTQSCPHSCFYCYANPKI